MREATTLPPTRDALLFTPGPLTTSLSVKQAMLRDVGSWHSEFSTVVANLRERLLPLAELSRESGWKAVLIGNIGRLFPADLEQLVAAIAAVLSEMGLPTLRNFTTV